MLEDHEIEEMKNIHQQKVSKLKKKLKSTQQKARRLNKKVTSLTSVIKQLKEKNLISSSCEEMLERNIAGVSTELYKKMMSKIR